MEYVYVRENHITKVIYDFDKFNSIKAIYEDDAQTALIVYYDGKDTLYDLNVESKIRGGATNLIFALMDFCFAIRKTEGIKIHKIKGYIHPTDRDKNREVYRAIYEKLKNQMNPDIKLKYYNDKYEELPLNEAAYLSKYKGKVRYLEFLLP